MLHLIDRIRIQVAKFGALPVRGFLVILVLYLGALSVYLANGRSIAFVDTGPTRHLALSLIRDHDLKLNEIASQLQMLEMTYTVRKIGHNVVSYYPVGTAFLAVPYFIAGMLAGIPLDQIDGLSRLEKWSGANLGALLAVLFWILLRRRTDLTFWPRLLLWAAFAFGTSNWVVNSQGLWQHIPLEIFEVLALLALPRKPDQRSSTARLIICGLCLGLGGFMRPTGYVLIPVWMIYIGWNRFKNLPAFALGIFVGILPQLIYDIKYVRGNDAGYFNLIFKHGFFENTQPLQNFVSLLASPSRGVLIFSPFLLLLCLWTISPIRKRLITHAGVSPLLLAISSGAIFLVYLFFQQWWAGWTYGSRFFSDMMPFLILLLCAPFAWILKNPNMLCQAVGISIALITIFWSVSVQALGAFRYDGAWDGRTNLTMFPYAAWDWCDNTIRFCFSEGKDPRAKFNSADYYRVEPGRIYRMGRREAAQFLSRGFYGQEEWGVWSRSVLPGVLALHLPNGPGKLYLGAMGTGSPYAPARFEIKLNGHRLKTQLIHPNAFASWQQEVLEIPMSAKDLNGKIELLEIWSRDGTRPWVVGRVYGMALKEMLYVPEGQLGRYKSALDQMRKM